MKDIIIIAAALGLLTSCSSWKDYRYNQELKDHFSEVDTNNDGVLSRKEVLASYKKHFDEIDTNNTGKISRKEAIAAGVEKSYNSFGRETNKGYITYQEAKKEENKKFNKADTNKDGVVDKKEFESYHSSWED